MALSDYKLKSSDYEGKRIADLSDRPTDDDIEGGDGLSADMLKAYFDYIPITVLGLTKLNGLIDFLTENGGGTLGIDEIEGLTDAQTSVTETIAKLLEMVEDNKSEIETSLANLAGSGRTFETVKKNAENVETIKGSGWNAETIKNNADQITAMKGTGWTSENLKTIADTLTSFIAQKAVASGLASLDASGKLVQGIDGSNITSGMVPIWAIPDVAKAVTVVVDSEDEMLELTIEDIQAGDSVVVESSSLDTEVWYKVIDDTKLGSYSAFRLMTAGVTMATTAKFYDPTAEGDLSIAGNFALIDGEFAQKANLSTLQEATILATSWEDNAATLAVSGVTATSNQEILPQTRSSFSTDAEYTSYLEMYQNANFQDNGQAVGEIYLLAMTDVPTEDMPIKIILRGD
ncbi:MAG: hypothetical protein R3Y65_00280 [Bacillota bacterium]